MKRLLIILIAIMIIVGIIVLILGNFFNNNLQPTGSSPNKANNQNSSYRQWLGNSNKCQGDGPVTFTHPPMNPEDVSVILPYGLVVDAHVTPIDHMYFSPKDFASAPDTYPVYAIADGITNRVSFRKGFVGDNAPSKTSTKKGDYRLDIEYTCSFYSYYDLITSLAPELATQVNVDVSQSWTENKRINIKAGQEIGRIGGQTLDWAVYNTNIILPGLLIPEHYNREPWKIHTDPKPLDYFIEPLKTQLYSLLARKVEPRTGKIDYDIDGKIVGNWFQEGTNWYAGTNKTRYWDGHLAIVYDYIDPTQLRFSIGNYLGKSMQFGIKNNAPDPSTVGMNEGLIKYELTKYTYLDGNTGKPWRSNELPIANPRAENFEEVLAIALVQLIEPRKLKVEVFPGQTADQVNNFTGSAQIYER